MSKLNAATTEAPALGGGGGGGVEVAEVAFRGGEGGVRVGIYGGVAGRGGGGVVEGEPGDGAMGSCGGRMATMGRSETRTVQMMNFGHWRH